MWSRILIDSSEPRILYFNVHLHEWGGISSHLVRKNPKSVDIDDPHSTNQLTADDEPPK